MGFVMVVGSSTSLPSVGFLREFGAEAAAEAADSENEPVVDAVVVLLELLYDEG